MAVRVADLCLGKPPIRSLPTSSTVADALAALKSSDHNFISVWSFSNCIGTLCMVDIICFLSRDDASPAPACNSPLSLLLSKAKTPIRQVDPSSSLLEAIDLIILEDAQNLVVPINTNHFCWLTQEDIIRFLLGSIGFFSPISTLTIDALGLISDQFPVVNYNSPAISAIAAAAAQTAVAVADDSGILIGEISPFSLACCDETVVAAVAALSAGELMAYIDGGGGPSDEIVRVVETRLKEKGLEGIGRCYGNWRRYGRSGSYSVAVA